MEEIRKTIAPLAIPVPRLNEINRALDSAAFRDSFASASQVLAQRQMGIHEALGPLRTGFVPDLSVLAAPPPFDLDRISELSLALSSSIKASLGAVDFGAVSAALQSQFEPAVERAIDASNPDEDDVEGYFTFLWTWAVLALQQAGAALDINTVLMMVLTLSLHYSSLQSSSADISRLGDRVEMIYERGFHQLSEMEEPVIMVVQDRLNLRTEPSEESHIITTMSSNQTVKLIRDQDGWCYVEYEDHVAGTPRHGWASRSFLKRLEP
ncbi:MAG: SH3 domain-containing protein [Bacteroidota bacterium]